MSSTNTKTYEPTTSRKVAFLGLGVMGFPMAGHLALAGHDVTVFNRSPSRRDEWMKEFKGVAKATPREAVAGCDIVFCCVGNDDDLRSVVLGADGAFAGMKSGAIFVDHTTASADVARELSATAAAQGVQFIDAPVSGGQAGAQNGVLTVMCGGEAAAFETVRPVACAVLAIIAPRWFKLAAVWWPYQERVCLFLPAVRTCVFWMWTWPFAKRAARKPCRISWGNA